MRRKTVSETTSREYPMRPVGRGRLASDRGTVKGWCAGQANANPVRHGELAEDRPVVSGDREVHNPRRLGKVRRQRLLRLLRLLEVVRWDVRGAGRVIAEPV